MVLCSQSRSHNKEKRRFCALTCGRETFEMGFLFLYLFSRDLISRWRLVILVLCSGCFATVLHTLISVQGGFEHFTFVCLLSWQLLQSRVRISLSDWKCLDSLFSFPNSCLALAICTFKTWRFSSISCRWQSKGLFSAFFGAVVAARCAPGVGVKDKCFGCSDSNSSEAEDLGISMSVRLNFLGIGESISLAWRKIFLYSRSFTSFALLSISPESKTIWTFRQIYQYRRPRRDIRYPNQAGKWASGEQFCFIACIRLAKEISLIKKVLNLSSPYFRSTQRSRSSGWNSAGWELKLETKILARNLPQRLFLLWFLLKCPPWLETIITAASSFLLFFFTLAYFVSGSDFWLATPRGGFACFPSFFALLENEWLPVKAMNVRSLVRGWGGGFACFQSFFALLENEWLLVKAMNVRSLVEVLHGYFRFTNGIWQVNSFYHVAKFSIVWLMCFFERIGWSRNNFRSLVCWLSPATVHNEW